MLTTLLLTAALVTPSPEPPFQPNRRQLLQSASGMAKYKPVLGPMIARAMLPDVVTSAGPRTIASFGGGGSLGGDLYLLDLVDFKLASTSTIQWSATTDPTAAKDVGFSRPSVGLIKVTNGGTGLGTFQLGKLTITSLGTPATPVITQGGAGGATAYSYKIVAKLPDTTTTEAGTAGSTATGNAALDGTNYNIVTWAATTNAHCYDVWRTVGGATQGKIATCTISPLNDTGLAGVGAGTEPLCDSTGGVGGGTCAVIIGPDAAAAGSGAVAIGSAVTGTGVNSVVIGPLATSTATSGISLGVSSSSAVDRSIAIGTNSAASNTNDIALGETAVANASYGIAIGSHATVGSIGATAFGHSAVVGTTSGYSIAIGASSTVPNATPNVLVGGASAAPLSNLYFGKGMTDAAPTAYTINGTGGSGADIVGGDLQLAPGISTGAAVPGKVKIRKTASIGTGSTAQTVSDLAYFGGVPLTGATAFFGMDGTFSDTAIGTQYGMLFNITAAGGASVVDNYGLNLALQDGASSPANSFAMNVSNQINSGNAYGAQIDATSAAAGIGTSSTGQLTGGAFASSATGNYATTMARTAGLNAGLVASNGAIAGSIFIAADGVTRKFSVDDNGSIWSNTGVKALADGVATAFVRTYMDATDRKGGILDYCVDANDATNYQIRCGMIPFTFINEAGAEACSVGTTSDSDGTPTGTLTAAITAAVGADANSCDLLANAVSSLVETTLRINYSVRFMSNGVGYVTGL